MSPEAADLSNCDREPIHIPGCIQPHGCLLACDTTATTVLRHSANAAEMLGHVEETPGGLLGAEVLSVIGERALHDLRNAITTAPEGGAPASVLGLTIGNGRRFDVAVHRIEGGAIIEFEPVGVGPDPLQRARALIGRISSIDDIDRLVARAARLAHGVLGYDRVMIYRFERDGAGKVVSEVRRPDLESFLGQYFPASDIPIQARALYLRNTIRIISDVRGERVPIVPELDDAGRPLDLSMAHLRSVSPVHCEYLQNMGVAASMSISVVVDGALWGLIACHHYTPRLLTMAERTAAELFGQFFSLRLHALKQKRSLATATEARRSLDRFLRLASHAGDVETLLRDNLGDFAGLLPCDGVGLWIDGAWSGHGVTPPEAAVPALVAFVSGRAGGRIWSTDALSRQFAGAEAYHADASGLLAVPLSQLPRDYLFFFRRELVQTLNWGGNPDKTYTTGPLGDRLTPRKSFAIWKEIVERQAQPWTESDLEIAEATRAATVEIVLRHNELMAEERGQASVRQRMLNEELNHRVKNILSVIRSLISNPAPAGGTIDDYVVSLQGRVQALAYAHDQVARGDGGGLLADLLAAELGPYRQQGAAVTLAGPGVWLDARAFSVMALILHELATNAAKYGALSRTAGRLAVSWAFSEADDVALTWEESGGPPVAPPTRTGFGSALIARSIPFDLGGEAAVDYRPEGLRARFRLPATHVSGAEGAAETPAVADAPAVVPIEVLPPGLDVLLVEDQMLIAIDAEAMLAGAGVASVTTAASVAEARERLRQHLPGVAVLDVNLGHGTSMPVAEELRRRGVPFVFATGYGEGTALPGDFRAVPVVRKPYSAAALVDAIARAVAAGAG